MPRYSVIIPAYNAQETLADAIASVLDQTCAPAEVIVVDDGSTDRTADIVATFGTRVRGVTQANQGPGAAVNHGVALARYDLLAFVDADDIWLPDKMARQIPLVVAAEGALISTAQMRQFRHGVPDDGTGAVRDGLTRSTTVCFKSVFDTVGQMISPPGHCGDMIDWMGRARAKGFRIDCLQEVLALRRIIESSLTYGLDPDRKRGFLSVAHAALKRSRERGRNGS